jgi:hypothetical protein
MKITRGLPAVIFFACALATAQNEGRLHRDFRVEGEALKECFKFDFGSLSSCAQTLAMGQPMHVAVGSLAPDNGVGLGLAFVEHKNFANEWRASWDADAQATFNGSWRAGAYMKAYRLPPGNTYRVAPLFNFYSQSISLNRVDYFGLGPNSSRANHSIFGFSENITGVNGAFPFKVGNGGPKVAIVAEFNWRSPSVRPASTSSLPPIGRLFTDSTAPGLSHQGAYVEPGVGLRLYPALLNDHIRLDYLLQIQGFISPHDSIHSFRRLNFDFNHQIPLYSLLPKKAAQQYSNLRTTAFIHNGPNDCSGSGPNVALKHAGAKVNEAVPCPTISTTQKLEGAINVRVFISESIAASGKAVPFYFMPTIGGSDLDGTSMLASYPDYRFRGPDLFLFRSSFEHSIGKLPIGAYFTVDEAKIAIRRDDVSIAHLRHTYGVGMTVHAGGLPLIYFVYAWGGNEGSHPIGTISPFLLGGSSRPSLF